jgi:hypothetical protein
MYTHFVFIISNMYAHFPHFFHQLHEAAKRGETAEVTRLLKAGVPVDAVKEVSTITIWTIP